MKFPLRHLVYSAVGISILLGLLQLAGCTAITHFREHRITKVGHNETKAVWVHLSFSPTRYNHARIPGIYDLDVYRDPYKCHFTIWGPFDELIAVDANLIVNATTRIPIRLDIPSLNASRQLGQNNAPYFPAGQIPFDIIPHEVETIVVETALTARTGELGLTHTITNTYRATTYEETGNRWWLAIMGM